MIYPTRAVKIFLFAAFLLLSANATFGQDPWKVAPHIFRVLFENDRVRVLQEWLRPGEKEPMHSHPRAVVYAVNLFKGRSISESGVVTKLAGKAGQVQWYEPEVHAVENTGRAVMRAIIVELKMPQNLPARESPRGPDPLKVASHTYRLLFENNLVRVLEFRLIPGQRTRTHHQREGVLYVLSGGFLKETLPSGKVVRQVFRPRQARWLEAKSHALENIGLTEVHLFIVELKSPPGQEKK
jgi:quercetin dioxygenase-like cupin family protein